MERIRGPQPVPAPTKSDDPAKAAESAVPNTGTPAATGVVTGAEVSSS
jgi:hypothetical protein